MSKKHSQRTRAKILAKREQPIREIQVFRIVRDFGAVPIQVPIRVTAVHDRSKYMPHFGAKQKAKIERQVLKLAA